MGEKRNDDDLYAALDARAIAGIGMGLMVAAILGLVGLPWWGLVFVAFIGVAMAFHQATKIKAVDQRLGIDRKAWSEKRKGKRHG